MHVIRLREPWKRMRAEPQDSGGASKLIYARTFHRPTGAEEQAIRLRVALHAIAENVPEENDLAGSGGDDLESPVTVRLNGEELRVAERGQNELYFELAELRPFNQLELLVACEGDVEPLPTFGTFRIHAVEIQIR